jgi:hypothetical protein
MLLGLCFARAQSLAHLQCPGKQLYRSQQLQSDLLPQVAAVQILVDKRPSEAEAAMWRWAEEHKAALQRWREEIKMDVLQTS